VDIAPIASVCCMSRVLLLLLLQLGAELTFDRYNQCQERLLN